MTNESRRSDNAIVTTVCAIGASAGGLAPVEEFFDAMPTNTNAAFVVVQHLSPDHESMMVSLLSRNTPMPVAQAKDGQILLPNHVYLIPPGTDLTVRGGRLRVEPRDPDSRDIPKPIDHFFASMASSYGPRSIAIVLSGTGSDGTAGIKAVHDVGGVVMAQDGSAAFDGMPSAASESGFVDAVMDPTSLAGAVIRFTATGQRPGEEDHRTLDEHEERILAYLTESSDIDFREYKTGTTRRRLERRMSLLGHETMADYADLVHTDEQERAELVEDLFIDVTEFFRDADAFDVVEQVVMPELMAKAVEQQRPFRIWVPGCATGEEAYSLTMLAIEAAEKFDGPTPLIQTFATDLHASALERAARGSYSARRISGLSEERLDRFFNRADDEFMVTKELRSMLTFARHNLLTDPPFTRVDLVSCRNLLIYFRTPAQERAISSMGFALRPGGVLFLGPSETLGYAAPDYEPIHPTWRLWRKEFDYVERKYRRSSRMRTELPSGGFSSSTITPDTGLSRAYDTILQKLFAGGLLINQLREVVYVFGNGKDWLEYPRGRPNNDVLTLIGDTNLRLAVAAVLREVEGGESEATPRPVVPNGAPVGEPQALMCKRIETGQRQMHFLIYTVPTVIPVAVAPTTSPASAITSDDAHVAALESELRHTRDSLQALLEEQEVSNEELNATNEELIASNEELQSTNEELSSVNEELRTLNDEHQQRIDQVLELSADLEQLMSAADIAVIFLAEDQTVRRFNEPTRAYFRVRDHDIGRPFAELVTTLEYEQLQADIDEAFVNGQSTSRTVRNSNKPDQRLVAQVSRYELDHVRSGVLLAIVDVTELEVLEEERLLATALRDMPAYFAIWNADHEYVYVNRVLGRPAIDSEAAVGQSAISIYGTELGGQISTENAEILQSRQPLHTLKSIGGADVLVSKYDTTVGGQPHVAGFAFSLDDFTDVPQLERAVLAETFDDNQTLVIIDRHGRTIRSHGRLSERLPQNWLDPDAIEVRGLDPDRIRSAFREALNGQQAVVVNDLELGDASVTHKLRFSAAQDGLLSRRYPEGSIILRVMSVDGLHEVIDQQKREIAELREEIERLRSE